MFKSFCVAVALLSVPVLASAGDKSFAASGTLLNNKGQEIGAAHIHEGKRGLLLHVEVSGLTPGAHGVHFHSVGNCSDPHDHFKAAAGHLSSKPEQEHGVLADKGFHEGDLPNIVAAKDGTAQAEFFITYLSLATLLDADGTALMIHANPDDHTSQPIGGAGDRVACAVMEAPQAPKAAKTP